MHSPPQCSILRLPLRAKAIGRLAMRTWLNGWVTTRRFHEAHQMKCILGCVDQDCQQHYLCGCPVLRQFLFPGFWSPTAFDRLARVCWRCLLCVCDLHLFHELLSQSSCLDLPWQVLCTQNSHCRRALRAKRPSTSARYRGFPQTKEGRLRWGSYLFSIELPLWIRISRRGPGT